MLQKNTNTNEQITCEPALPSGRFHRVIKLIKAMEYNRQLKNNFNNLYR